MDTLCLSQVWAAPSENLVNIVSAALLPIIAQSFALFLTLSSMYWKDAPKVGQRRTGRDRDRDPALSSFSVSRLCTLCNAQSHSNEPDATTEL